MVWDAREPRATALRARVVTIYHPGAVYCTLEGKGLRQYGEWYGEVAPRSATPTWRRRQSTDRHDCRTGRPSVAPRSATPSRHVLSHSKPLHSVGRSTNDPSTNDPTVMSQSGPHDGPRGGAGSGQGRGRQRPAAACRAACVGGCGGAGVLRTPCGSGVLHICDTLGRAAVRVGK